MNDDFQVPVRTLLPGSTYAKLYRAAEATGATVSDLVAELVRRALNTAGGAQQPPAPPKRDRAADRQARAEALTALRTRRATEHADQAAVRDAKVRELHGKKFSDGQIAVAMNVAQPTVSKWRRDLELPSLYAFGDRRQKRAPE